MNKLTVKARNSNPTSDALQNIPFWKVQSIGNDFVLVHDDDIKAIVATSEVEGFLPKLSALTSERRYGIGSDGLLLLSKSDGGLLLRMFNPDGTEDFCGNGLRCAAFHGHRLGWVGSEFVIRHRDRNVVTSIGHDGRIATTLGVASYRPEDVPVRATAEVFNTTVWNGMIDGQPLNIFGSALSTGSTHVVIPTVALPDNESFKSISRAIEIDHRFPSHTSVIWTKEESPNVLSIRIWERGAGETQGCGTGSSAAAADYMRRRGHGGPIVVHNPGGSVTVDATSWDKALTIKGNASEVFAGSYSVSALLK